MEDKIKQIELEIIEQKNQVDNIITETIERGDKLEELEQQSEQLKESGNLFKKHANKLKWNRWWKKSKLHLCIGIVIIIIVGIIVVSVII